MKVNVKTGVTTNPLTVSKKVNVKTGVTTKQVVTTGLPAASDVGYTLRLERYHFTNEQEWLVVHNHDTDMFIEKTCDVDGKSFYATRTVVDKNSFKIHLAGAMSGYVDVLFPVVYQTTA